MIAVETDPTIANRIANSEGVGEFLRPDGAPVDLSGVVTMRPGESGVVVLSNGEDALGAFEITAPGIYQAHVMFAKSCRGARGVKTGREMIDYMFSRGADIVWGDVPRWNKPARWFARRMGMIPLPSSDEDTEVLEVRKAV